MQMSEQMSGQAPVPRSESNSDGAPEVPSAMGSPAPAAGIADRGSTTEMAKGKAADVGGGAVAAGKRVAEVAAGESANVAGEARRQAGGLVEQAGGQLRDQAERQQQRIAASLRSISEELGAMAERAEQQGPASNVVRQVSDRTDEWASWLEGQQPEALLDEVRSFARRRPAVFLGIAALAGVVAGRVTRGLAGTDDGAAARHGAAAQQGMAAPATTRMPRTESVTRMPAVGDRP